VSAVAERTVLVKDRVFDHVGYAPHSGQVDIHRSSARMKVVSAGRRLGKSQVGGHELTPEALLTQPLAGQLKDQGKRREFWIVGPEYSDSEKEFRVLYNDLEKLEVPFDRPGTYNNPLAGDMHISLWKGTFQVHAKSAKYPETLVGEGLSGVIMAEAAKLKERVWTKFIRPTLADFRGWAILSSTPEGKNWFYEAWQRGQDPKQPAWASWRRPSWDNPILFPLGAPPASLDLLARLLSPQKPEDLLVTVDMVLAAGMDPEILDMAVDMSLEKFNQEIGADFTEFVGRVFKSFDEEVHIADIDYDPRYPLYACCDYGWTNPFVWLFVQVDVWDNINVIAEYRATQRDINDIAADLAAIPLTKHVKTLFPDPAEPGDTAVLEKALHIPANTDTGGEKRHRIEYIRQALKVYPQHGLDEYKRPRLLIDRSCTGLRTEMSDYRYAETKGESLKAAPEDPLDKDDHGPEALGRFFRGHYGPLGGDLRKQDRPRQRRSKH
jgi:hypothetical protein